ncbi:glycosyltransferase family 2 protein [candidate division KSB1 bacterium]|nr:glycosyltransferase family 2 protein [candidate division KSB1 bacterium]NIR72965.1 glycosyltransferase family 2 protein [candidate division KSB1 bacterium]NIS25182.1 glycosyltransferase family 2 protein [candidate division KSB1 bacterium]NIT72085.1 glycosyltransferase family 2 protein [candidate division KSB1 bacterium]NIU25885.1 glycosyltransferase family 2 protein [candidate division KSB1 bacterium]
MTKVSIVIPVYCEKKTVREIVRHICQVEMGLQKELIAVDDGSTDGTREILKAMQQENPTLKIFFHERNLGKGAALRTGFSHATGQIIIVQDADLEYNPKDYSKLIEPILEGKADVVYGSRFLGGPQRVLYFWHYLGNKFLTLLSNMLSNLNLNDMETCYKVFHSSILHRVEFKSNRFGFEPEFTMKVAKLGCRIFQVPISYSGRTYQEGKKITWRDGCATLWHILRFRFMN